jgi:ATP-dependent DNA helicase RecG
MSQDMDVLKKAQLTAKQITHSDPLLQNPENKGLRELVDKLFTGSDTEN